MFWKELLAGVLDVTVNGAKGWVERIGERQTAKLEIEKLKVQAEIARINKMVQAEIDWDLMWAQQAQSSWKDEWFTILLSIPVILIFFPVLQPFVVQGFQSLELVPDWYKGALGIAIAAAFGYRKFADFMMKGKLPQLPGRASYNGVPA